jgi:hypothetical protein
MGEFISKYSYISLEYGVSVRSGFMCLRTGSNGGGRASINQQAEINGHNTLTIGVTKKLSLWKTLNHCVRRTNKKKLRGFCPQANYTNRVTATCRRS